MALKYYSPGGMYWLWAMPVAVGERAGGGLLLYTERYAKKGVPVVFVLFPDGGSYAFLSSNTPQGKESQAVTRIYASSTRDLNCVPFSF